MQLCIHNVHIYKCIYVYVLILIVDAAKPLQNTILVRFRGIQTWYLGL